jgi:mono/diheme cytochrome c family protein
MKRELEALSVAVLTSVAVLSGTALLAHNLRQRAAAVSHEQASTEALFPSTPVYTPEAIAQGRKLFLNTCAHCHGIDASGDEGPDLHDLQVSDRFITNTIKQGFKGEMPAFGKKYSDTEIAELRAYLRSLN